MSQERFSTDSTAVEHECFHKRGGRAQEKDIVHEYAVWCSAGETQLELVEHLARIPHLLWWTSRKY